MVAKTQRPQPEGTAEWLEGELGETKARLHKVEGELEQALKKVWSMESELRKLVEAISSSGVASTSLTSMREELRQVQSQMSKFHDRQSSLADRTEEAVRRRQAEGARDRQDIGALAKQVDGLIRGIQQYDGRAQAMEDAVRHMEEAVAGEKLDGQGLERQLEEISTRSARTHEATLRLDQEVSRLGGNIEQIRATDVAADDRLSLITEQARRLGERLDKLEDIAPFPEEARELLKRANLEREQLAQRMVQVERLSTEVSERLQEFLHGIARLDQRSTTQGSELLALTTELQELTEKSRAQLKRVFQILLRQRRRQAESMSQEIKELGEGELHSWD